MGGFRHPRPDSINTGWRNPSFRGYADYMQTPEFEESLVELIDIAKEEQTVIMCAEAVPWRCHRSLIADALLARGIAVREITGVDRTKLHTLMPWARLRGTHVTYPGTGALDQQLIGASTYAPVGPTSFSSDRVHLRLLLCDPFVPVRKVGGSRLSKVSASDTGSVGEFWVSR